MRILILLVSILATACGSDPVEQSFPTYEECFTDHAVAEALTPEKSITICCLDHPIGSSAAGVVCGADAAACSTYVTAQLLPADATATQITTGCTDYIAQKGM